MKKEIFVTIFSLALLLFIATNVAAIGLSPSFLYMDDVARGNVYEKNFRALNLESTEQIAGLHATGDSAEWMSFKDIESGETIENISVPGKSNLLFTVRFDIPADAPNGVYEGFIELTPITDENTENPVTLVTRNIYRLTITGNEKISGTVDGISTKDTESGQPLRIIYAFRNTGNVGETPLAKATIYKDGKEIESIEAEGEYTKMGSFMNQELLWDTSNRGTGNFTAKVSIYLEGNLLLTKELKFNLAPRGTYTVDTLVGEVKKPSSWSVNEVQKIEIQFFNKGKIDVNAKIVAEVVKDGKVVDVIEGDELAVEAGKNKELYFYYKPTEEGKYEINPKILFSGHEDKAESFSFVVKPTAEGFNEETINSPSSSNTLVVVLIVLVVVLILGLAGFAYIQFKKRY